MLVLDALLGAVVVGGLAGCAATAADRPLTPMEKEQLLRAAENVPEPPRAEPLRPGVAGGSYSRRGSDHDRGAEAFHAQGLRTPPVAKRMNETLDVASSFLASGLRFGLGRLTRRGGRRPDQLLELYEFEACPFCRKAREGLTAFDLEAMIYPCHPAAFATGTWCAERGGRDHVPLPRRPSNTGREMYEVRA